MKLFNFKQKGITLGTESGLDMLFYKSNGEVATFGAGQALSFYEKSLYVNKAIEKRAEKVSQIKLYLKKGDEEIFDHEILDILAKPNSYQTWEQFSALWSKWYDLYGEAYILILKNKEFLGNTKFELLLLDPKDCEPQFTDTWSFSGIKYKGTKTYSAEEIIYDYRINPRNQFRGISLLKAGLYTIDTSIELDKMNNKLVRAGGKVEGIINFKGESITADQITKFKEKYKEQLEEMAENGNVVFMGGDANYQRVNLTPEELGYLGSKKMTLNDICILTDVPKVLLNSVEDVKFDNAEASLKIFLSETILPLTRRMVNKLNEKQEIIPAEYELVFVDPSPEDKEYKLKLNENGAKNYYLTPNEMRANVGLDPIDGGDDIFVPFTMSKMNEEPEKFQEEKGLKKKEFNHPLRDYDFRRAYFKKRIILQDKLEDKFLKQLKKYLKGQTERIIEGIGQKDLLGGAFNFRNELKIGLGMLAPLLMEYMKQAGKDAKELVGNEYQFVWSNELETSLNNRAEFFINSMNETTFDKLRSEFTESFDLGENRQQLVKRIENTYGDISKGRAKTIARTEVHSAVNNGTLEGYKQAGMPIKIWVAVIDDRTRDEHLAMDGEERPINMPFSNGEMFPNEINCRCQI